MRRLFVCILFPAILMLAAGCAKTLTLYTDADRGAVHSLMKAYTDKTGEAVNVVWFRSPNELADAIAVPSGAQYTSAPHGNLHGSADVVLSSDMGTGSALMVRDTLLEYTPQAASGIPSGVKLDGRWYGMAGRAWVLAWNTSLVHIPPASLMDLASGSIPAGQVSMINPNYILYYPSAVCAAVGRDKTVGLLQTLIDRQAQWEAKPADTMKSVAEGRAWVCLTTLAEAKKQQAAGAKISFAVPDQAAGQFGAFVQYNVVCVNRYAPNTDKAKKLEDFLLSPETEALAVKLGLGDAALRDCGPGTPVARPLSATVDQARAAMNDLGNLLVYFTSVNPDYKGK